MQSFNDDMPAFQNLSPMNMPAMPPAMMPSSNMPAMPNGMQVPANPMPPMPGAEGGQSPDSMPPFMMDGSMPNPLMQKKSTRSRALGLPF